LFLSTLPWSVKKNELRMPSAGTGVNYIYYYRVWMTSNAHKVHEVRLKCELTGRYAKLEDSQSHL